MTFRPVICLLLGAVVLSACGSDTPSEETAAEADRNAQGEVLGGTISDDMIPLDRLRSQSPPVREAPARPAAAGGSDAAPAAETSEEAASAEAAPAAEAAAVEPAPEG
ncbi:hypothetical protein [Qipengyuania flava]|uniref:hypothetical protein n=1 Tax=Qipengyuania flava TaxID=192812 RepID=UPI001C6283E6|nr:hypothetical protein [Qipengyuania flava]QYJ07870.1 hypothetical protein KUV82_03930 [Qipengyuania flava]